MCARFSAGAMAPGSRLCNRHDQPSVLHALQANQAAGEFLDPARFAMDNENLQTRVMVQMCMTGRDHQFVIGMLKFRQLLCHAVGVMVINQGDSAHDRSVRSSCSLRHKAIANQVAKGLGPVGVAQPRNEIIEALKEIGIERNSDSTENTHCRSKQRIDPSIGKIKNSTSVEFVPRLSMFTPCPELEPSSFYGLPINNSEQSAASTVGKDSSKN